MAPRASLPGADELFRRTSSTERTRDVRKGVEAGPQDTKSTKLQVAKDPEPQGGARKAPKHDEKITFYCTGEDLMALEQARLQLRSQHGVAADRGRIVRAALAYILEDFEARGEDAILLRHLEH